MTKNSQVHPVGRGPCVAISPPSTWVRVSSRDPSLVSGFQPGAPDARVVFPLKTQKRHWDARNVPALSRRSVDAVARPSRSTRRRSALQLGKPPLSGAAFAELLAQTATHQKIIELCVHPGINGSATEPLLSPLTLPLRQKDLDGLLSIMQSNAIARAGYTIISPDDCLKNGLLKEDFAQIGDSLWA